MTIRPARLIGVETEESLAERLLDDTATAPGCLMLLAFSLSELYRQSGQNGWLRHSSYVDVIGGVDGAIKRRAGVSVRAGRGFPERALDRLFEKLVEVDHRDVVTRRRAHPIARRPGHCAAA